MPPLKPRHKHRQGTGVGVGLLLGILGLRLLCASQSRGFFQPDEYYQGLSPAYNAVFYPTGEETVAPGYQTWEWRANATTIPALAGLHESSGVLSRAYSLATALVRLSYDDWYQVVDEVGQARGGIRSPVTFAPAWVAYTLVKLVRLQNTQLVVSSLPFCYPA